MDERCICCGEIIPEGRMVCPQCEYKYLHCENPKAVKKYKKIL